MADYDWLFPFFMLFQCGYQVIALRHAMNHTSVQDSLLGGRGLRLDVLLPGDTLHLR